MPASSTAAEAGQPEEVPSTAPSLGGRVGGPLLAGTAPARRSFGGTGVGGDFTSVSATRAMTRPETIRRYGEMRRWRQGALSAMLSACGCAGSVATFGWRGQLRNPGLNKSMNDRHQHARKRPFATELSCSPGAPRGRQIEFTRQPGEPAAAPTRMTSRHPARRRRLLVVPSWSPLQPCSET